MLSTKARAALKSSSQAMVTKSISFLTRTEVDLMRGSRKFCQRGSNFDNVFFSFSFFFLVDKGREDLNDISLAG